MEFKTTGRFRKVKEVKNWELFEKYKQDGALKGIEGLKISLYTINRYICNKCGTIGSYDNNDYSVRCTCGNSKLSNLSRFKSNPSLLEFGRLETDVKDGIETINLYNLTYSLNENSSILTLKEKLFYTLKLNIANPYIDPEDGTEISKEDYEMLESMFLYFDIDYLSKLSVFTKIKEHLDWLDDIFKDLPSNDWFSKDSNGSRNSNKSLRNSSINTISKLIVKYNVDLKSFNNYPKTLLNLIQTFTMSEDALTHFHFANFTNLEEFKSFYKITKEDEDIMFKVLEDLPIVYKTWSLNSFDFLKDRNNIDVDFLKTFYFIIEEELVISYYQSFFSLERFLEFYNKNNYSQKEKDIILAYIYNNMIYYKENIFDITMSHLRNLSALGKEVTYSYMNTIDKFKFIDLNNQIDDFESDSEKKQYLKKQILLKSINKNNDYTKGLINYLSNVDKELSFEEISELLNE